MLNQRMSHMESRLISKLSNAQGKLHSDRLNGYRSRIAKHQAQADAKIAPLQAHIDIVQDNVDYLTNQLLKRMEPEEIAFWLCQLKKDR